MAEPNEIWGRPALDADDNGNFIVVYPYSSDLNISGVYGSIYGPTGAVIEQFFPIGQPIAAPLTNPDVAYLSGGRFMTVWRDNRNDANGDIYAAILGIDAWVPPPPIIPIVNPWAMALLAMALLAAMGWTLKRRKNEV